MGKSQYAENLVLKGGLFIYSLTDFDDPTVNTYSLETTITEKRDAILSLMGFSSRMKDYYDIFTILPINLILTELS